MTVPLGASSLRGDHHIQFNVMPCCTATQTRSVRNVALRSPHRWPSKVLRLSGSTRTHHPPTAPVSVKTLAMWASPSLCFFVFALPRGHVFLFALPRGFLLLFTLPTSFSLSVSSWCLPDLTPPPLLAHATQAYRRSHGGAFSIVCNGRGSVLQEENANAQSFVRINAPAMNFVLVASLCMRGTLPDSSYSTL